MERNANVTQAPDLSSEILTVDLLSDYLHCHPSTIYRLVKLGAIPHFRLGSDLRFEKGLIRNWIKEGANVKAERRN
jgi:excisionase family DNA binding protein